MSIVCVLPPGDTVQYEGRTARARARSVDVICNGDLGAYTGKCSECDRHLDHTRYDGDRRPRTRMDEVNCDRREGVER